MVDPITRDYVVRRGDVWTGETFRLISASGASFWASPQVKSQARSSPTSAAVVHEFSVSPQVTTEGSNGVLTFTISLSSVESSALSPGNYVGDIEVSSSQLPKSTLVSFNFTVVADVTRQ